MKKTLWQVSAVAILIVVFAGCKKSSSVHVKTKTELITQNSWKLNTAVAAGFGDVTSQIPACSRDNIYTFVSNGSGTINESTSVCSPSQAGPFTWSFLNSETTLHLNVTFFSGGSSD